MPAGIGQSVLGHVDDAAHLLKLLAHPQRLRILCLLADGERCVGELNEHTDLSQSALSQHLSKLRDSGLVETRREAQTIYYRLSDGTVRHVISSLRNFHRGTPLGRNAEPRQRRH